MCLFLTHMNLSEKQHFKISWQVLVWMSFVRAPQVSRIQLAKHFAKLNSSSTILPLSPPPTHGQMPHKTKIKIDSWIKTPTHSGCHILNTEQKFVEIKRPEWLKKGLFQLGWRSELQGQVCPGQGCPCLSKAHGVWLQAREAQSSQGCQSLPESEASTFPTAGIWDVPWRKYPTSFIHLL